MSFKEFSVFFEPRRCPYLWRTGILLITPHTCRGPSLRLTATKSKTAASLLMQRQPRLRWAF